MKRSYFPERCGDVGFVQTPYFLVDAFTYLTGTTHGTPHAYDTHVPLIFFGPGVKAGIRPEKVAPQTIAAVLAAAAGLKPPKMAASSTLRRTFSSQGMLREKKDKTRYPPATPASRRGCAKAVCSRRELAWPFRFEESY